MVSLLNLLEVLSLSTFLSLCSLSCRKLETGGSVCLESSEASRDSWDRGRSEEAPLHELRWKRCVGCAEVCCGEGGRRVYEPFELRCVVRVLVELVLDREAARGKGGARERSPSC